MGSEPLTWYEKDDGTRKSVTSSNSLHAVVLEGTSVNANRGVAVGRGSYLRAEGAVALGASALVFESAKHSVALG